MLHIVPCLRLRYQCLAQDFSQYSCGGLWGFSSRFFEAGRLITCVVGVGRCQVPFFLRHRKLYHTHAHNAHSALFSRFRFGNTPLVAHLITPGQLNNESTLAPAKDLFQLQNSSFALCMQNNRTPKNFLYDIDLRMFFLSFDAGHGLGQCSSPSAHKKASNKRVFKKATKVMIS